jgi:hypothetical protein
MNESETPPLQLRRTPDGVWQASLEVLQGVFFDAKLTVLPERDEYLYAHVAASVCCDVASIVPEKSCGLGGFRFMFIFKNVAHGEVILPSLVRASEIDALSINLMQFLQKREIVHLEPPARPKIVIFRSKRPMLMGAAHTKKPELELP